MSTPIPNPGVGAPGLGLPPQGQPQQQPVQDVPLLPPSHIHLAFNGDDPAAGEPPAPDPEAEAREIQAMSEGVATGNTIECLGERYRIRDKVGLMPLMKFAHVSRRVDEADLEAMECVYNMLKSCIHPDDWGRFEDDTTDKSADMEDLMPVVAQTIEILSARPTQGPSDSSGGPSSTGRSSTPTSSSAAPESRRVPDWVADTVPVG